MTFDEDIYRDGEKAADPALRIIGVAAVVRNPWHGKGYVEDLGPEIRRICSPLGKLLTDRLIALAGSGDVIEAYGKARIAGTDGEMEHASALIHTLQFGNFYREAVGARTYLGFTNTRGPANTQIQIPLMDKHDSGRRSHYLTSQFAKLLQLAPERRSGPSALDKLGRDAHIRDMTKFSFHTRFLLTAGNNLNRR